ncbi:hypothetical protein T492DRAFT_846379 [Pavlovales sp. CCMP2436]|nr:hypothetical protein T492DRAFT_846379 [Pavlovales sp. CCMP2436]
MQRETAVLVVQRAFRRFGARRVCTFNTLTACMRSFGRMDRYTDLRVTAWVYSDGHIEIDMDASTESLFPLAVISALFTITWATIRPYTIGATITSSIVKVDPP